MKKDKITKNIKYICMAIIIVIIAVYFLSRTIENSKNKKLLENIIITECNVERMENNSKMYRLYITISNQNSKDYEIEKLTVFSEFDYNYVVCNKDELTNEAPIIKSKSEGIIVIEIPESYASSTGEVALSVGTSTNYGEVYKVNIRGEIVKEEEYELAYENSKESIEIYKNEIID